MLAFIRSGLRAAHVGGLHIRGRSAGCACSALDLNTSSDPYVQTRYFPLLLVLFVRNASSSKKCHRQYLTFVFTIPSVLKRRGADTWPMISYCAGLLSELLKPVCYLDLKKKSHRQLFLCMSSSDICFFGIDTLSSVFPQNRLLTGSAVALSMTVYFGLDTLAV